VPIERFRNKKIRHARSDIALFPERRPTLTVWEKRCWKKPDLNFTSRQTSKRNDKICTCTSSAWDVDQGIMLLDHAALVVAPALKDYSVNATTAEIHAPLTVGVLRVPYCHARQRPADCRVAISAKHLTSTWRTSCTATLSVACEMTELPVVSAAGSRHNAIRASLVMKT
jgi:hypothetical protein